MNWLKGKKTYIGAVLIAVLSLSATFGWIDQDTHDKLFSLLVAWGFAALRAGVPKPTA